MAHDVRTQPLPTSGFERRLIAAAGAGDTHAQHQLLKLYEPMVRRIAHRYFVPGAESEDLAQEARMAIIDATRRWDSNRRVPFSSFAWLCATREARMVVDAARANKHRILTSATSMDAGSGGFLEDHGGLSLVVGKNRRSGRVTSWAGAPDHDPVAKTLAREQLHLVVRRGAALSPLERRSLALAAEDCSYREIADELHVGVRAVNNALQRARAKLREPLVA
ncbi:sigma-70 family RNA polymerase sigma factor [Solirubrobacter sp. CPCC 204708]|uniref:Sigma-70 family RNA polymerase sigma factor n=1 Tax=Solirubrobacter deserti TaxID=2282478 RepID=A0ABT4RNH3_9ACTN|nr:sigma-70 family RNA polymerase sigma factor [Solirubrobacter deserti]MBE2318381.1 sigma-70 family RNA polymerase sigma factor [Solirubrobacter deserti]MDA0140099.1 sigma-70 family RNA polymerase sigma factor [Solirubrobacter deserti]